MKNKIKSILKWAGGKSLHAPYIHEKFQKVQKKNRYIEPFFGGGSVYFYMAENNYYLLKNSIISDTNKDLIELYKDIKRNTKVSSLPRLIFSKIKI